MNILVIDAQGGGVGKQLVAALKKALPQAEVAAVGTNRAERRAPPFASHESLREYCRRGAGSESVCACAGGCGARAGVCAGDRLIRPPATPRFSPGRKESPRRPFLPGTCFPGGWERCFRLPSQSIAVPNRCGVQAKD